MENFTLLSTLAPFSSIGFLILGSLIVIVSYLFNLIASRYSIPSVLLLILLGVAFQIVVKYTGLESPDLTPILEVLGIVGLIMIVLEASLGKPLWIWNFQEIKGS